MGTSQSSDLEDIRSHCNHEVSSCPRLCGRRRCCRAPALEPLWQQSLLWPVQLWLQQRSLQALLRPVQRWLQLYEALHLWWPGLPYFWLWQEEAEAEPESQYYGGYGYNSGLYRPYSGIYNAGYSYGSIVRPSIYGGMGYRTYGYGKREAEAEPEAQYWNAYGSGLYRPYSGIYSTGYNYGSIVRPSIYGAGYYY